MEKEVSWISGCLSAGIDWLLVLRQAVRHLLERYRASRVDVDNDKARLTELYTAHDPAKLAQVDRMLAANNTKESRDRMWTCLKTTHAEFFEKETEPAAG